MQININLTVEDSDKPLTHFGQKPLVFDGNKCTYPKKLSLTERQKTVDDRAESKSTEANDSFGIGNSYKLYQKILNHANIS